MRMGTDYQSVKPPIMIKKIPLIVFLAAGSLSFGENATQALFSGSARPKETLEGAKQPLFLELGEVSMLAQMRLNGKDLGVVWCPPWRVELTPALRAGENRLEISVVNGWWNQLVADPKHKRTQTNIRVRPNAKPMSSGLFGPVTLQGVNDDLPETTPEPPPTIP